MPENHVDQPSITYRPEIDGLRAISVVGVILFHFGIGLTGGYVGVDVFFVISGYLITSIIDREIRGNKFSMQRFWARRVRRILPAVSAVVIFTLLGGILILEPQPLKDLAKSSLAQSLMISNVHFWRDAGYFSELAELKPLLHTWSLSVEEQFYVFLPLLMVFLARISNRALIPVLWISLVLSLGLSIWGIENKPDATFYLLPTRAWELLAGSVAALSFRKASFSPWMANLLSLAGILLILFTMCFYTSQTSFPGLHALPPVLGAFLFLVTNAHQTTFAGRVLSLRPLVGIGLISYSLYLWHWPLLSFARHMIIEQGWVEQVTLLGLSFLLSFLSWKYVENPFRNSKRLRMNRTALAFGLGVSCLLLLAAGSILFARGLPGRFNAVSLELIEDVRWTGSEYKEEIGDPIGRIRFGAETTESPDFVVWGDSHAMVLGPLIESLSEELKLSGAGFISPACPPVPGLWMPRETYRKPEDVLDQNKKRLEWIQETKVRNVILVGRWTAMCGGTTPSRFTEHPTVDPGNLMVADDKLSSLTPEESKAALKRQLGALLTQLEQDNVSVWILLQVPETAPGNPAHDFSLASRFPLLNPALSESGTTRANYEEDRKNSLSLFKTFSNENLKIIDPIDSFFPNSGPFTLHGSRSHYRDENHLTKAGAEHFLHEALREALSRIGESGKK